MSIIRKLLFEGTLESIPEIGMTTEEQSNGIIGPGHAGWSEKTGHYSKIVVKTDAGETKEVTYDGVILADSIGNPVQVHENKGEEEYFKEHFCNPDNYQGRIEITDTALNRRYL